MALIVPSCFTRRKLLESGNKTLGHLLIESPALVHRIHSQRPARKP
jgi:hypothetical protein